MSRRITISVRKEITSRECGNLFDLLCKFVEKPSYARMIVYERGVYYALTSDNIVAFKAALRLASLEHVVSMGS
jgi:hypothetical protein